MDLKKNPKLTQAQMAKIMSLSSSTIKEIEKVKLWTAPVTELSPFHQRSASKKH